MPCASAGNWRVSRSARAWRRFRRTPARGSPSSPPPTRPCTNRSGPAGTASPSRSGATPPSAPSSAASRERSPQKPAGQIPTGRGNQAWQAGPVPSLFDDLSWRGLVHQLTDHETLPRRLDCDRLVLYIGFDPTANSLHVGHLQQICLLRRCQGAGHRPIALVGGGTGMIGDPSGKSEERNLLTLDELDANRASVARQLSQFLDFRGPEGALLADNADWLGTTPLLEFLRDVGKLFSVNEMIRKESVR